MDDECFGEVETTLLEQKIAEGCCISTFYKDLSAFIRQEPFQAYRLASDVRKDAVL